jgi:hypothetical protein
MGKGKPPRFRTEGAFYLATISATMPFVIMVFRNYLATLQLLTLPPSKPRVGSSNLSGRAILKQKNTGFPWGPVFSFLR